MKWNLIRSLMLCMTFTATNSAIAVQTDPGSGQLLEILAAEIAPPQNVRYSDVQKRIFDQSCTKCHSAVKQKGKVDLSSYDAVTQNPKKTIVIPGSPEESLVYKEIVSGSMPPKGPTVSAEDIAMLKQWIIEGALND